jgi:hypothetical protein
MDNMDTAAWRIHWRKRLKREAEERRKKTLDEKFDSIDIESEIQRDFDKNGEKSLLYLGKSFGKNFPSFNPSTDFSPIVYDVKVNLQSRNRHNVVSSDQAGQGDRFLVHRLKELRLRVISLATREPDDEDDIFPIYINIFARALCGVDRVRIEVFDLIKAELDARFATNWLTEEEEEEMAYEARFADEMAYETMRYCAKYAHKWLVSRIIVNVDSTPGATTARGGGAHGEEGACVRGAVAGVAGEGDVV